jgi:hypothetical protein
VTRDDIRKLVGGYATGTLTEAERKLLFEAALDDQELFDELAREQALKELLDEPGARERLITALGQPKPKRFIWWPWAVAATAAAGLVVAITLMRPPARQEIAAVTPAPEQVVTAERAQPEPTPPPESPAKRKAAKPAPTKEETKSAVDAVGVLQAPTAQDQAPAAPAPPQVRAFGGVAAARLVAPPKPARFAFDYVIQPDRRVQITAVGDGYLQVTAGAQIVFPASGDGRVLSGSVTNLEAPNGATELSISFSAQPGVAAAPVSRLQATSGTVEDPNPSLNSRLSVTVPVQ